MSFAAYFRSLPQSLSLVGHTVLITGSSKGLGRAMALRLARLGAAIQCADVDPSPAMAAVAGAAGSPSTLATHQLIQQRGGKAGYSELDVRNEEQFVAAVADAVRLSGAQGRLDALINNAGVGGLTASSPGGILHEAPDFAQRVLDINLGGVLRGCRLGVAQMLEQDVRLLPWERDMGPEFGDDDVLLGEPAPERERGVRGSIVNIASIHGMVAGPGEAAYSASKGGVLNLTRTVAADYAPHRIACNSISPGYCSSTMGDDVPAHLQSRRRIPWPHGGLPRDIASAAVTLVRDAAWVTGSNVVVDGGTTTQ